MKVNRRFDLSSFATAAVEAHNGADGFRLVLPVDGHRLDNDFITVYMTEQQALRVVAALVTALAEGARFDDLHGRSAIGP